MDMQCAAGKENMNYVNEIRLSFIDGKVKSNNFSQRRTNFNLL